eukprot:4375630-Pyramimonas_sp.AAC.1
MSPTPSRRSGWQQLESPGRRSWPRCRSRRLGRWCYTGGGKKIKNILAKDPTIRKREYCRAGGTKQKEFPMRPRTV